MGWRLHSLHLPTFDQRQAQLGAFSSKQVLEIIVISRTGGCPERRPSPHAIIHYSRIFHRQQLALEGSELMNMHRLILINYAFDTRASWGGQEGWEWLGPETEGLLTGLLEKQYSSLPRPSFPSQLTCRAPPSSVKTWGSGFQRLWSLLGCCSSDSNAGGSGGQSGSGLHSLGDCFRPTGLENNLT